ncbi:unnamed protein product [Trifolium pratense]|uniref:Uncharacterized protein n=1 Tax=Trifolium pratense TaxID=57577 RepID=A0ACB0JIF7_TRIPR|nr:unnamed protein product [Trifolium pratense]
MFGVPVEPEAGRGSHTFLCFRNLARWQNNVFQSVEARVLILVITGGDVITHKSFWFYPPPVFSLFFPWLLWYMLSMHAFKSTYNSVMLMNLSSDSFVDATEPLMIEVDQIYHRVCPAPPIFYKYNPVNTIKTYVIGTLKSEHAWACKTSWSKIRNFSLGIRFMISASAISWYMGILLSILKLRTKINPIGMCLTLLEFVIHGFLFTLISSHSLNFIAQALRGESLTVQSPGTQTRSFCYVSDLVDGLIRLMGGSDTGPINLGNPG